MDYMDYEQIIICTKCYDEFDEFPKSRLILHAGGRSPEIVEKCICCGSYLVIHQDFYINNKYSDVSLIIPYIESFRRNKKIQNILK